MAQLPGMPRHFDTGQFAGFTMRTELSELQKADRGRKCASVDKRPLDPPPVALLRFFHVVDQGLPTESESPIQDYSAIDTAGLVCAVDLFPVPLPEEDPTPPHPSTPSSHVAKHLSGSTFVQPILTDHPETGAKCLVFLFSNLSVAIEGDFYLRYRIFDILAGTTPQGHYPVLAACFGGAFRVYTANLFPGLVPSTPLTLQLSQAGERVNVRRALRKPQGGGEAARTPEDEIDDEEYA